MFILQMKNLTFCHTLLTITNHGKIFLQHVKYNYILACYYIYITTFNFYKIKSCNIDNFTNSSQPNYLLYSDTTGYWVLLKLKSQPSLYYSDDMLGLFAFLSGYKFSYIPTHYNSNSNSNSNAIGPCYPILDVMTKNLPLNITIKNLQTSLAPRQSIFTYNTIVSSLRVYLRNQTDTNMNIIMTSCKTLKYNLNLTDTDITNLTYIRCNWDTSINSNFTIDNFNNAYTLVNKYIASRDIANYITTIHSFYKNCNL